jgi:type IV pilus assembly protein PilB
MYKPEIKILTAEDPIEFTHPGVQQAEVNLAIGNTFARFLRGFLRQDPDVIMVGEIRDAETAEMSLRAAQTGHMLLSTLHTNNSTASVKRLMDLVDDPNGIASNLIGVMAQRLVRRICRRCAEPYTPPDHILREWFDSPPSEITWMKGRGCEVCGNSGFAGRLAVAELWIPTTEEMILINKRASGEELRRSALQGMPSLAEDALLKAMLGSTTLEEALRVVPFEDVVQVKKTRALRIRELQERHAPPREIRVVMDERGTAA